jgi:predicted nucleotidyltransferase
VKSSLPAAQIAVLVELSDAIEDQRYALIGATALSLHVPLSRFTADLDLIVACDATNLDERLQAQGWRRDKRLAYRWQLQGINVDIVAASVADLAAGYVTYTDSRLNLVGCDLALQHAVTMPMFCAARAREVSTLVANLPSIVVMKMAAWLDRPHERTKDLGDIALALTEMECEQRRWEAHPADLDYDDVSPFLLGCDIAVLAERRHLALIQEFLRAAPADTLGAQARWPSRDREQRAQRVLAMFARGIGSVVA